MANAAVRKRPRTRPPYRSSQRLDSACAPLAVEQQKPNRAHDKLDGQEEEEHAAWHAIDDEAEDSPDGQRVSEEHGQPHAATPA